MVIDQVQRHQHLDSKCLIQEVTIGFVHHTSLIKPSGSHIISLGYLGANDLPISLVSVYTFPENPSLNITTQGPLVISHTFTLLI
jgi:hypothetical protein